ncbi:TonB-dependent receptor [Novosphingobium sp. fls2-241-R2A-195]|uniref:TonB-dependent receptor n=1 Tax=Novosphingobium sp. fls2-241-R2A-195 TaxID=3040296 RepID=UPI00254DAEDF|nr:TonB-dependent receptor [Novosphingobium sp. fls2-241-R2A-195]
MNTLTGGHSPAHILRSRHLATLLGATALSVIALPAAAQEATGEYQQTAKDARPEDNTIIVTAAKRGHGAPLVLSNTPAANPASVTVITQDDISNKLVTTAGDLLRGSNGVQVSDYGQVGETQGITMRGWSNGYDSAYLAYYQDGVQRNAASHISVNGYVDLNPLIPETINQFTIVRGPFDTRYGGNFAQAGSVVATTRDFIPNSLSITGGSYGFVRAVASIGHQWNDTSLYTIVDGQRSDGYRDRSGGKLLKTFTKFATPLAGGRFTLGVETYNNKFEQPGYIDLGLIKDGAISAKDAISDSDHGSAQTYTAIANYLVGDYNQGLEATASAGHSALTRTSTTYPYPQYYRRDARWNYSASVEAHRRFEVAGIDALVLGGVSIQHTNARLTELPSENGEEITGLDPLDAYFYQREHVRETTKSVYASLQLKPVDWLKITAGGRYDHFAFDVDNQDYDATENAYYDAPFKTKTGRFSPKVGAAINPVPDITVYVNYGESPRSPSAFSELTTNPDLNVSHLSSKEAGIAWDPWNRRLHFQANFYKTVNSNEVGQVGYTYVNLGTSRRKGLDLETSLELIQSEAVDLKLTGNYSAVKARLADGGYVPYVAKWLAAYGARVDYRLPGTSGESIRVDLDHEFFGPQKLDSLGAYSAGTYNRVSGKVRWVLPEKNNLNLWAGGIWYPGSVYNEFGFSLSDRIYVAPKPKVQFQVGASVNF